MSVFSHLEFNDHEQVCFYSDPPTGLRAIVAIHDTTLGPSLGGVRMWPYASDEEALTDVLRLSRAMTYKASVAGLNLGGGKSVIIGDAKNKTPELLRAFGRCLERLGGRYVTAEDVGTSVSDMEIIRQETRFVTGMSPERGGSGDPSSVTGLGVYHGMRACAQEVFGSSSLKGLRVAVQGVGKVGYYLCSHLHEEGAKLFVTDVDLEKVKRVVSEFGATPVDLTTIHELDVDIVSPCALGAGLNDQTIPKLRCKIVAGGANNQLAEDRHGAALMERDILYAPDYVINSGGIINVYQELVPGGYHREEAMKQAANIFNTMTRVIRLSKECHIPPHEAAHQLALERINSARKKREMAG